MDALKILCKHGGVLDQTYWQFFLSEILLKKSNGALNAFDLN